MTQMPPERPPRGWLSRHPKLLIAGICFLVFVSICTVIVQPEDEGPIDKPSELPAWATDVPVLPPHWTTLDQAKQALLRCRWEIHTVERYGYETTPERIESFLENGVFSEGWESEWVVPPDILLEARDIWAFGYSVGCWHGPQKFPVRAKPLWHIWNEANPTAE